MATPPAGYSTGKVSRGDIYLTVLLIEYTTVTDYFTSLYLYVFGSKHK